MLSLAAWDSTGLMRTNLAKSIYAELLLSDYNASKGLVSLPSMIK